MSTETRNRPFCRVRAGVDPKWNEDTLGKLKQLQKRLANEDWDWWKGLIIHEKMVKDQKDTRRRLLV